MAKSISGHMVWPYDIDNNGAQLRPSTPMEYYMWGITGDPEVWIFREREDQHALFGELLCLGYRPKSHMFLEPKGTLTIPVDTLISNHNIWGTTTILFAFNPVGVEFTVHLDKPILYLRDKSEVHR